MATIINVEDLTFAPELAEEQKDLLSELDFSDYKETWLTNRLDKDAVINVLFEHFGIDLDEITGDPVFWPTQDEISLIEDAARKRLTEKGTIGDGICDAIYEVTGIDDCNKDSVYSDTGLSSWHLSFE